jgi:predicted dehydrogenase
LARASACHAEGRGFESHHPLQGNPPETAGFFRGVVRRVATGSALHGNNLATRARATLPGSGRGPTEQEIEEELIALAYTWARSKKLELAMRTGRPAGVETPRVGGQNGEVANVATTEVGIGLIGCGRIAHLSHLRVLKNLPGARLAAIAERDPERLSASRAIAPQASAFHDAGELLASSDVDAVVICLPTELHAPVAIEAFAAGKDVYVEKPLARDLDEADEVVQAWRRSGRAGMVGFNYRFHSLFRRLRGYLADERIGELVAVRSVFSSAHRQLPEWKRSRQTGGGALLDLASHHVDLVGFVTGREIESVFASVRSVSSEDDTAVLELTLEGGVPVQTLVSMTAVDEDRIDVYGSEGRLSIDRFRSRGVLYTPAKRPVGRIRTASAELGRVPAVAASVIAGPVERSYAAALRSFVESVRDRTPVEIDLVSGYRSLAVIAAAEESARRARPATPRCAR